MAEEKNNAKGDLSKITVAALILIILIGAGVFIWWSYQPTNSGNGSDTTTQNNTGDTIEVNEETSGDTTNEFDTEISQLDKTMNSLDDSSLSETSLSDDNLGI